MNIWQSYKQECGCLIRVACLANTLLKDEESAQDNHVFACNFAKCSPLSLCLPACRCYNHTAEFIHITHVQVTLPCEILMSAKQAINNKLQCSVAAYLRCSGVVNNQIKKSLLLSLRVKKFFNR